MGKSTSKEKNKINIKPALLVIDMQNCFMADGGSFDKMGFGIKNYQRLITPINKAISKARRLSIPIFFTKAIREASGVDLLDKVHKILPAKRRERLRRAPLCIRGTWDGDITSDLKVDLKKDHIVEKRRDSSFQGTELDVWLEAMKVNTLILGGIDTAICVESTLRDAFNTGYDVILLSDLTASRTPSFYKTTIDEVKENFGLVMKSEEFFSKIKKEGDSFSFSLQ